MKKQLAILSICVCMLLLALTGCGEGTGSINSSNAASSSPSVSLLKISDYFPFEENVYMKYAGEGNEYATFDTYVEFIKGDRIQKRTDNGGTVTSRVYENKNGQLKIITSQAEHYYREDITASAETDGSIILKEPIAKGTTWISGTTKYTITAVDMPIQTTAGNYNSIEVTSESNMGASNQSVTKDYYSRGIGLVKTVATGNNYEVSSQLTIRETNKPFIQRIKFFYPYTTAKEIKTGSKEIDVSFTTNEELKDAFNIQLQKTLDSQTSPVLSKNAHINSIVFEKVKKVINADVSKEFVTEMNAGSSLESQIIRSAANTLCNYFGADGAYITLDGKPYESGHYKLNAGETFKPDYTNIVTLP